MTTDASVSDTGADLPGLYEQWRALTLQEGEALRAGNWSELARLQASKCSLQSSILSFTDTGSENRGVIQELIQLESRNAELLSGQLQQARVQQRELDAAARTLRSVRTAYCRQRPSAWHSYS